MLTHQDYQTSLHKALNRIREILDIDRANEAARHVTLVAPIKGSALKFKRIAQAPDIETLWDYMAEITFGLIFAGLEFEIEFEPLGEKGPDLLVSRDSQSAYVEVKRFRPSTPSNDPADDYSDDLIFKPYGNPLKDMAKVRAELLRKFAQVNGGNGIVAFWSDNHDLESLEFGFAGMDVRSDFETQIQQIPDGFLFTVFGSYWKKVGQNQQLYCEAIKPLMFPFSAWAEDLENASVNDCQRAAVARQGSA